MFSILDRQILAILKIPITADLGLSDTQLGLMGGIAFASLYSTLAIPLRAIADRGRVTVISTSVAVWSAFTALLAPPAISGNCSLRAWGVGIGEAGGVAPSYALIADYSRPHRRARARHFPPGHPDRLGDRPLFRRLYRTGARLAWAFALIGLAGIPVALALRCFVPDRRGATDAVAGDTRRPSSR